MRAVTGEESVVRDGRLFLFATSGDEEKSWIVDRGFEEALSEQERTQSQMFNKEPLSMVNLRQASNGSASTSSNTASDEKIGTFFKREPREKWKKKNKFPVLFYSKEHEPLAKKIAELEEFSVELGTINWESFNDGFSRFVHQRRVRYSRSTRGVLASFHNRGNFRAVVDYLLVAEDVRGEFYVGVAFLPNWDCGRVAVEGEVATAVTLARMLSSTPPSRGGPTARLSLIFTALQTFLFWRCHLAVFRKRYPDALKAVTKIRRRTERRHSVPRRRRV